MLKRNRNIDATDPKFANRTVSCLAQLTRSGDTWYAHSDGSFSTVLGIWYVVIDGPYISFARWRELAVDPQAEAARHPLTTQTGRLLNLLVTVPGAAEVDRAAQDRLHTTTGSVAA